MNARANIKAALAEQWPRRQVDAVSVDLPLPVSTNDLWRPAGGRMVKTERYRVWARAAADAIGLQRPGCVSGPYSLTLLVNRRRRSRADLGNMEKGVSDALQAACVIDNDLDAERIVIEWSDSVLGCRAIVEKWIEPPAEAE